jgi:hypothetical protein
MTDNRRGDGIKQARIDFMWCLAAFTALLMLIGIIREADAQEVYFNPQNAVPGLWEPQINYSMWAWSQRLGTSPVFAGYTDQRHVHNAIVVRVGTPMDFLSVGLTWGGFRGYTTTWVRGPEWVGYEIVLNPTLAIPRTVTHELGHANGLSGHLSAFDVMGDGNWPRVSVHDTMAVSSSLRWPTVQSPSPCFVEITNHHDLYLPYYSGHWGLLRWAGLNRWKLAQSGKVLINPGCQSLYIVGDTAYIDDARSPDGNYWGVFREIDGYWHLIGIGPR